MKITFDEVPSPSTLIQIMDTHPVGAALFVTALLILSVAVTVCFWLYFRR